MKRKSKHILLKGKDTHQHTLYGDFKIEDKEDFPSITIEKETILKHEKPDSSFGEHFGLTIETGEWSKGSQVEFNPFEGKVTEIWD